MLFVLDGGSFAAKKHWFQNIHATEAIAKLLILSDATKFSEPLDVNYHEREWGASVLQVHMILIKENNHIIIISLSMFQVCFVK